MGTIESRRDQIRAVLVLAVGLWMLLLGTPGLDFLRSNDLQDPDERAQAMRDYPDALVWAGIAVVAFNRDVRMPLVRKVEASQRPFRLAQTWNLYRNGPPKVRHMEIWIDGERAFRSQSDALRWLGPQLGSRRIRPMIEASCIRRHSKNWRGLMRWVAGRAVDAFPEAQEVEIRCKQAPFPGDADETLAHRIVAKAPDWKPRLPK